MSSTAQSFITKCLDDAVEQATTEDGISPDADLMEDDEARHHIGEQAFVNMMDTFEDLHTFTEAQDMLLAEYMADSRNKLPDTTGLYKGCGIENSVFRTVQLSHSGTG